MDAADDQRTAAMGSRPFLVGVDDDEVSRSIINSECPQRHLHEKLLSAPTEVIPEGMIIRRMEDARAVTKDRNAPQTPPMVEGLSGLRPLIPIALDGPEHAKWRRVLDPVFAPKKVALLEGAIRQRANELLDELVPLGTADMYDEWCEPLPSSVFLDLMGIPQSELTDFLRFKNCVLPSAKFMPSVEETMRANVDCDDWFTSEFERRDRECVETDDLLTSLRHVEFDGRPINLDELLGICKLLMIAGLDTVGGTLGCILAWMARHPAERAQMVSEPDRWPAAIEELLRWESPVQGQGAYAVADIELPSGAVLPKSTFGSVYISAANLDPEVFEDPMTVRLDRNPNPHIAFASGFHRCLGSHLARLELRACLEEFHKRIPDYSIPDGVDLTYWGAVRAPRPLPLVW